MLAAVATLAVVASYLSIPVAEASVATAPSSAICRASANTLCIDQADGGKLERLHLHATLHVTLGGSGLVWSALKEIGPIVLHETGATASGARQLNDAYRAIAKGRTTLQATASPRCVAGQACPEFVLLWRVQVVVTA
jgi:hypothetical protein